MRPSPGVRPRVSHLRSGLRFTEPRSIRAVSACGLSPSERSRGSALQTQRVLVFLHHIHQCCGLSLSQMTADMVQISLHKSDLNTATPDACFCYFSVSVSCFSLA